MYEILFKGEEGKQFLLTIHDSKSVDYNKLEKEDVMINGKSGFYIEGPGPSLHWTEGNYHYILRDDTDEKDTKERMIEIAESFR